MKRTGIIILIFSFVLPLYLFNIIYKENNSIKIVENIEKFHTNENIQYCIDTSKYTKNNLNIEGWAIEAGKDNKYFNKSFVLIFDDKTFYKINTVMKHRADITSNISDGYNYDNSGMVSSVKPESINSSIKECTVGFLIKNPDGNEQIVKTDKIIKFR